MNNYQEEINILFISYAHISFKGEISAKELEINWGDGSISTYKDKDYHSVFHDFEGEGLYHIRVSGMDIRSINVSRLSLTELTLKDCRFLEYLDCSVNELNTLDLSGCPNLEELYCNSNNLPELNLPDFLNLQEANVSYNILEKLDVTNCVSLQSLYCCYNRLRRIKLNHTVALCYIDLGYNMLDKDDLHDLMSRFFVTNRNITVCHIQNPGSEFYDSKTPETGK